MFPIRRLPCFGRQRIRGARSKIREKHMQFSIESQKFDSSFLGKPVVVEVGV